MMQIEETESANFALQGHDHELDIFWDSSCDHGVDIGHVSQKKRLLLLANFHPGHHGVWRTRSLHYQDSDKLILWFDYLLRSNPSIFASRYKNIGSRWNRRRNYLPIGCN